MRASTLETLLTDSSQDETPAVPSVGVSAEARTDDGTVDQPPASCERCGPIVPTLTRGGRRVCPICRTFVRGKTPRSSESETDLDVDVAAIARDLGRELSSTERELARDVARAWQQQRRRGYTPAQAARLSDRVARGLQLLGWQPPAQPATPTHTTVMFGGRHRVIDGLERLTEAQLERVEDLVRVLLEAGPEYVGHPASLQALDPEALARIEAAYSTAMLARISAVDDDGVRAYVRAQQRQAQRRPVPPPVTPQPAPQISAERDEPAEDATGADSEPVAAQAPRKAKTFTADPNIWPF